MKNLLLYGLIAVGGYFAYQKWDVSTKREWLSNWLVTDTAEGRAWKEIVARMTAEEVKVVYEFATKYAPINDDVPQMPIPASLQSEIEKISNKYNIFT